jgi:hypothetical protein
MNKKGFGGIALLILGLAGFYHMLVLAPGPEQHEVGISAHSSEGNEVRQVAAILESNPAGFGLSQQRENRAPAAVGDGASSASTSGATEPLVASKADLERYLVSVNDPAMKTALVDQMALSPAQVKQVISEMLVIPDRRTQALEALVVWVGHMENPEIRQVLIAEMRTIEPVPGESPSELYQSAQAALGEKD